MDLMEFFLCSGTQVFSAGDLCTRCGAIVGLPHNFSYNTIDDVKVNEISILGVNAAELQADEESAQDFQQLIESLVLSENAKKFAITRELHMTSNDRVLNGIFISVVSLFFGVGIGQQIILSRNIRRRYLLSVCIRLVSAAIGLTLFLVIREMLYYGWDKAADEAAIKQGYAYFEGAVEYYQKLIQRQEALDNLMAKNKLKGESLKDTLLTLFDVKGVSNSKRLERVLELDPTDSEETPT
ncbi:unnamed protein product [Medioppia subpectinata]|uniref:Transmembrane protein n=1 Tax=Medioppia subpectinata TaxID=1979941 RepID=A0A7R9LGF4_9ACAR|nr:unnamed protein product [Medioppia subpectinata]CAG2118017.1 unnamed protein product [Medioppia subpectinata]